VWVPRHPHRLVVATCGVYGKASLVMWDGGTHWRSLHPVRQPENECFELFGVTDDGRQIVYGHDPNTGVPTARLSRRHWLKLPAR
jgi:hypothetical protein